MKARTGKIARLPAKVRKELNERLRDGEMGTELLAWLNGLPEVQAVLAAHFEGRASNEPNLADWAQFPETKNRSPILPIGAERRAGESG
jgi:hypothetical protein